MAGGVGGGVGGSVGVLENLNSAIKSLLFVREAILKVRFTAVSHCVRAGDVGVDNITGDENLIVSVVCTS
jgi:hypothetical protein